MRISTELILGALLLFGVLRVTAQTQGFPEVAVQMFDPVEVNPNAKRFQLADYDAKRDQVLFYPEGNFPGISVNPSALGTLLVYHVDGSFTNSANYDAYDLTQLVDPAAGGFCGGVLDEAGNADYLVPLYNMLNGVEVPNGLAVQIDLTQDLSSAAAYKKFDITTLGLSTIGYCDGIAANGYVYFVPAAQKGHVFNGNFLRYDPSQSFTNSSAWSSFDLTQVNANAAGFQSGAFIYPYIYLVPYFQTIMIRYDTRAPLNAASSYEAFDLSNVTAQPLGLTGAVAVGQELVLIPWIDPIHIKSISTALLYDTTQPLTATSSWESIDLTEVNPSSKGYEFGWLDKNGFVWFVPDNNLLVGVPPIIAWNSQLPFDESSSWQTYSSSGIPASTGAAYDAATNTAWLSPYGSSANFSIAQLQMSPGSGSPGFNNVSAASYDPILAPQSVVAAFGIDLATSAAQVNTLSLPTTLNGTTVSVKDSAGTARLASLFYISPQQVAYEVPSGTALGLATITVASGDGTRSVETVNVANVAPALFTADGSGHGVPAGVAVQTSSNGEQTTFPIFECSGNTCHPLPIDVSAGTVDLWLFGTGVRNRSSLSGVTCRINGISAPVQFAGAQGQYAGLDQINVQLLNSMQGAGTVNLVLTVDGQEANTVQIEIK